MLLDNSCTYYNGIEVKKEVKMSRNLIFKYAGLYLVLLAFVAPGICVGQEGMEVLNYYFDIDVTPRQQWYPHFVYNPIENEFMGAWRTDGRLRNDCSPDDAYDCKNSFATINGRRVSPEGELLGELMEWSPPELGKKHVPRLAHNVFTNEYMLSYCSATDTPGRQLYVARMDNVGALQHGPYRIFNENPEGGALLPEILFNPKSRNYLLVYNDRHIFNAYLNNVGYLLDENGDPIKGPFEVGNQTGDFYAVNGVYNSQDDTFLLAWEDFRNVADWIQPCDIYGALLDGDGDMIKEIAIMDDFGMPDAGDARVPAVAYNSDKNEFLVVWEVKKYAMDEEGTIGAGLRGRIINADGTFAGEPFLVIDAPRIQHWPTLTYVEEEKKYFMTWTDSRDDGLPPGDPWYASPTMDIYASWMDASGTLVGDEILIAKADNWQSGSEVAYSPLMKRFLIVWYDRNGPNDWDLPAPPGAVPFAGALSDARGTIYGAPSFLTVRVVEQGTGTPIEDAQVVIIGLGLFATETTNIGGWCNVVQDSQRNGRYFILARKNGNGMAMKSVTYGGEAISTTIELK
jgi:hypothetical protein